jgi:hypothetical protein
MAAGVAQTGQMVETSTHLHTSKQAAISKDHVSISWTVPAEIMTKIVQIPRDVLHLLIVNL